MEPVTTDTNEELTRYLLGEMSEEEQTEFEMRYFCDAQLFGKLCAWRNNLIDSYVSGRLAPPMRDRFEAGIDKSWAINERIRFAETLQGEIDVRAAGLPSQPRGRSSRTRESWWTRLSNYRRLIFVSAILLALLGVGWLIVRFSHDSSFDRPEAGLENSSEKSAPAQTRERLSQSPALPASPGTDISNSMLTVPLSSDLNSAANDVRADVLISQNTVIVKLLLIIEQPQDVTYRATINTVGGVSAFETDLLRAHPNEVGNAVELYVPANRLAAGDYVISLSASNDTAPAGTYHLRVRKS